MISNGKSFPAPAMGQHNPRAALPNQSEPKIADPTKATASTIGDTGPTNAAVPTETGHSEFSAATHFETELQTQVTVATNPPKTVTEQPGDMPHLDRFESMSKSGDEMASNGPQTTGEVGATTSGQLQLHTDLPTNTPGGGRVERPAAPQSKLSPVQRGPTSAAQKVIVPEGQRDGVATRQATPPDLVQHRSRAASQGAEDRTQPDASRAAGTSAAAAARPGTISDTIRSGSASAERGESIAPASGDSPVPERVESAAFERGGAAAPDRADPASARPGQTPDTIRSGSAPAERVESAVFERSGSTAPARSESAAPDRGGSIAANRSDSVAAGGSESVAAERGGGAAAGVSVPQISGRGDGSENPAIRLESNDDRRQLVDAAGQSQELSDTSRRSDDEDIALAVRAGSGGQLVTLHLAPPALGPLTIVMSFTDSGVQTQIVTEDDDAVRTITGLAPLLRRSLAELWDVKDIRVVQRTPIPNSDALAHSPKPTTDRLAFDKTV